MIDDTVVVPMLVTTSFVLCWGGGNHTTTGESDPSTMPPHPRSASLGTKKKLYTGIYTARLQCTFHNDLIRIFADI